MGEGAERGQRRQGGALERALMVVAGFAAVGCCLLPALVALAGATAAGAVFGGGFVAAIAAVALGPVALRTLRGARRSAGSDACCNPEPVRRPPRRVGVKQPLR